MIPHRSCLMQLRLWSLEQNIASEKKYPLVPAPKAKALIFCELDPRDLILVFPGLITRVSTVVAGWFSCVTFSNQRAPLLLCFRELCDGESRGEVLSKLLVGRLMSKQVTYCPRPATVPQWSGSSMSVFHCCHLSLFWPKMRERLLLVYAATMCEKLAILFLQQWSAARVERLFMHLCDGRGLVVQ